MIKRIALLIVFVIAFSVHAQDDSPFASCEFDPTLASVQSNMQSVEDWDGLVAFNQVLTQALADCQGLSFQGSDSTAVGPFELEAGVYIVHYSSSSEKGGLFQLVFNPLDTDETIPTMLISLEAGQSSESSKSIEVLGGRYLVDTSNMGVDEWAFYLEKID